MSAYRSMAIIGAAMALGLWISRPCPAMTRSELRDAIKFPPMYFEFSIPLPDREWIEAQSADPKRDLEEIRKSLKRSPDDADRTYRIGVLCERMGNRSAAVVAFRQSASQYAELLRRDPSNARLTLGHARSLRRAGQHRQAISILEKLIRTQPKDWEACIELAYANLDLCKASVESALEICECPQGEAACTTRPVLSLREIQANVDVARKYLDLAVKHAPKRPEPYYARWASWRIISTIDVRFKDECATENSVTFQQYAGMPDLRKAAEFSGDNPAYLCALGITEISQAMRRRWMEVGKAHEGMTFSEQGTVSYQKQQLAAMLDRAGSDTWRVQEVVGLISMIWGRKDEALGHFREAYRSNPAAVIAYGALLVDCRTRNALPDAVSLIRRQAERLDSALERLKLARVYAELGQSREAEVQCQAAMRTDPRNTRAHHMMGILLLKRAAPPAAAIPFLKKAMEYGRGGEVDDCRFALGAAYLLLDNRELAGKVLAEAQDPQARELARQLGYDRTDGLRRPVCPCPSTCPCQQLPPEKPRPKPATKPSEKRSDSASQVG